MTLKVDFTDVEAQSFEAKPAGWYHIRATDVEIKETSDKSKNPGLEYPNFELTIVDDPANPQKDGKPVNGKFWVGVHLLIPNAAGIVKSFLTATGAFTDAQLEGQLEFDDWAELTSKVLGTEFWIRNKPRTDPNYNNGDPQDNVSGFKPLNSGPSKSSSSSSLLPS